MFLNLSAVIRRSIGLRNMRHLFDEGEMLTGVNVYQP